MTTKKRQTILATALLLGISSLPCRADKTIIYSHDTGKGTEMTFGNGRVETYDVAIMMADKAIKGSTIKAIRIPLGEMKHISHLKVWLTKRLALQTENGSKVNAPDILSQDATVATGMVDVTLDTPYTIDADTLFVGYSFSIDKTDESNKRPFTLTTEQHDGGFWIHSSQTYKRSWMDYSDKGSSTMQVLLEGLPANAVSIAGMTRPYSTVGKESSLQVTLSNHGYNGIQSIDYDYEIGTLKGSGHQDLAHEEPAVYDASTDVTLPLPAMAAKATYPVKITISKVNGGDNADEALQAATEIDIYDSLPVHRAVLEEYTGTWCGNCPRGFVGMEVMKRLFPQRFIGISYHNNDPMEIMASSLFPSNVQKGLPDSWLDRTYETDAYYGAESKGLGIDKMWTAACNLLAQASVSVKGQLVDNNTKVEAEACITFPLDAHDANYKVEWILVADSLHGDSDDWAQNNYFSNRYAGGEETFPEPEFRKFYEGDDLVKGLYYNDVIIASSRLTGTDSQLPASIKGDAPIRLTHAFDLSQVVNTQGKALIQDVRQLRVVALLIGAEGNIVNGAQASVAYDASASLHAPHTHDNTTPTIIYDLCGRRLKQVEQGVNIVRMSNGETKKVIRK